MCSVSTYRSLRSQHDNAKSDLPDRMLRNSVLALCGPDNVQSVSSKATVLFGYGLKDKMKLPENKLM